MDNTSLNVVQTGHPGHPQFPWNWGWIEKLALNQSQKKKTETKLVFLTWIDPLGSFTPSFLDLALTVLSLLVLIFFIEIKIRSSKVFSTDAQFYEPAPNFAPFMATLKLGMKQGLEQQTMAQRWSDNTDNSNGYVFKSTSILQKHKTSVNMASMMWALFMTSFCCVSCPHHR